MAPVAQGIEHRPPEAGAQVRILPGVPRLTWAFVRDRLEHDPRVAQEMSKGIPASPPAKASRVRSRPIASTMTRECLGRLSRSGCDCSFEGSQYEDRRLGRALVRLISCLRSRWRKCGVGPRNQAIKTREQIGAPSDRRLEGYCEDLII
jgi:hypothetical protein